MFPDLAHEKITSSGHRYLGSYIGTEEGKTQFVEEKIKEWITDIQDLSEIAKREPQLAYSAYVYGLSKRWNYLCRTTPNISQQLKKLEYTVQDCFLPAILNRMFSCTDEMRNIFALPCRYGGLSIYNMSETCDKEYEFSKSVTMDLTNAIYQQSPEYREDLGKLADLKSKVSADRDQIHREKRDEILLALNDSQKLQLELASEKGASSWLTALPLKAMGYTLNKQQFNDAMCLRYNMKVKDTARLCVCGEPNTLNHLLICKQRGYVSLRHNSLRDLFAELLQAAGCRDVIVEPPLLPTSGVQLPRGSSTEDSARLDVSARNMWNPLEKAFLDIRVFHAQAPSNRSLGTTKKMYEAHESQKKIKYNQRILQVERATFTPVVFSTTGGMGKEAKQLVKRIAERTSRKSGQSYSDVMKFLRTRLRFDLLRTTIIALRGARGKRIPSPDNINDIDMNLVPEGHEG